MNSVISIQDVTEVKYIHLLYAPTNFCNMGCQYCYLGAGTDEKSDYSKAVATLKYALDACISENIIPFNLSFHGGEATSVPRQVLSELLEMTQRYYFDFGDKIKQAGFNLNPLHIKTNLYNFDKLYDLFDQYQVSISGSVDLPLSLHEKYRTDKQGKSTLKKIKANLSLLASYPHNKKISCVVTKEHLLHLEEFIEDIRHIHFDVGLDMTKFNIMFAFDSVRNVQKYSGKVVGTEMLSDEEQVFFYQKIKAAFAGTELDYGLQHHWFKEFTPEFCCSAVNCGDKFFLLQSNGDVYSCPRGQSSPAFRYGNLFETSIGKIVDQGWKTIEILENTSEANEECYNCNYLPYCNQGCVFVRQESVLTKSYTCHLQKAIYADQPEKYPAFDDAYIRSYSAKYRFHNHLGSMSKSDLTPQLSRYITPELEEDKNSLSHLIASDDALSAIYDGQRFKVTIDSSCYKLQSAILNTKRELAVITSSSKVFLHIKKDSFDVKCDEPVNNYLQLMLLRNTMVSYGDEGRTKQEHIADYSLYQPSVVTSTLQDDDDRYYRLDITSVFQLHRAFFLSSVRNNLFVTTKTLREYHYAKQKKNAFYHIQAINLPFPQLEFYWHDAR